MLVGNTKAAEKLIIDRAIDLGFVEGRVNNEQVSVTNWFQDELGLISCSTSDPKSETVCDVTRDLKKYKWVMREAGSGTAQISYERRRLLYPSSLFFKRRRSLPFNSFSLATISM